MKGGGRAQLFGELQGWVKLTDTMHPVQSLLALKPAPHFPHLIHELPDPNRLNDTDRPAFHCLSYFLSLSSRHQSLGSPQSQGTGLGSGPWVPCTDPHFPAPSGPAVAAEKALSTAPASPAFGGTPGTGLGPRSGVLGFPVCLRFLPQELSKNS